MSSDRLLNLTTWFFITLIPLAFIIVYFTPSPRHTPPKPESKPAPNADARDHPMGYPSGIDDDPELPASPYRHRPPRFWTPAITLRRVPTTAENRATLLAYLSKTADNKPSSSPSTLSSCQILDGGRSITPTVAKASALPPSPLHGAPIPPHPPFRHAHKINTHIDRLMFQRHRQPIFDDNSDFDFQLGEEEESWGGEEVVPSSSSSNGQDLNRHHPKCRESHVERQNFPPGGRPEGTAVMAVGGSEGAAAAGFASEHHNKEMMNQVLQLIHDEAPAKAAAKKGPKHKQEPPPLLWRRSPLSHSQLARASSPLAQDIRTDDEISRSEAPSSPPSSSSSSPPTPALPHHRTSISSRIDALMRRQGIQQTIWAHVDISFERSAGEHQLLEVDSYIHGGADSHDEDGAEPGDGNGDGEVYFYRLASSPPIQGPIPTPPFTPSASQAPRPQSQPPLPHASNPPTDPISSVSLVGDCHAATDEAWRYKLHAAEAEARDHLLHDTDSPVWTPPVGMRVRAPRARLNACGDDAQVKGEGRGVSPMREERMAVYMREMGPEEHQKQELITSFHNSISEAEPAPTQPPNSNFTILPYSHRYDADLASLSRDIFASELPSTSVRTNSSPQSHPHPPPPQPQKQVYSNQPPPSSSPASRPLCASDPVFGSDTISVDTISPNVRRQIEMRAGGFGGPVAEEALGEQDWSDDEYRPGDVAGD